jgi:hypothetical protein
VLSATAAFCVALLLPLLLLRGAVTQAAVKGPAAVPAAAAAAGAAVGVWLGLLLLALLLALLLLLLSLPGARSGSCCSSHHVSITSMTMLQASTAACCPLLCAACRSRPASRVACMTC